MKETYFLTRIDYLHFMRLIDASWNNKRPKQLQWIVQELYNRHNINAVTRTVT